MASAAKSPAIGIDLGTTNSCVGVFQNGQVQIIENDHGNRTTPSCVVFEESQRLIGDAAMNMMAVNPTNTVCDVKRLIGRRFDDPVVQSDLKNFPFTVIDDGGKPKIQVEYKGEIKTFFPEEMAAMILFKMKETAETYLGESVVNAVVSVPAYFNDAQRRATIVAAKIAGLNVQLINEPTAAALAYGYRFKDAKKRNVLIFDLGGGTLDVSLLTIENGSFLVRSTSGNSHLGGEDFNTRLVQHFMDEFKKKFKKDVSNDKGALSSLQSACERAKRCLSSTNQASIAIDSFYDGIDFYSSISRARFEELNEDLFEATIDLVDKTICDANMLMTDVDEVVLVGGSTRIPKIRNLLQEFFDGKELSKTINPDEAVAHGAAIRAAILNGDSSETIQDLLLFDVAPFTIGIWSSSSTMNSIIQRNTIVPIQVTKSYKTSEDNQTTFSPIRVYEIDGPDVSRDSKRLGYFQLEGFPAKTPKGAKFEVTFNIQEDGIFYITAVSRGFWSNLTVTCDENSITEEEMERMIADAERYRQDDLEQEKRATTRNDLESFCSETKSKIERAYHPLKEALLEMIERVIQWLENGPLASIEAMDRKKQKIERLLHTILSDPQVSLVEEGPMNVPVGREIHPNVQGPSGTHGRNEEQTSFGGGRSKYCLYNVD